MNREEAINQLNDIKSELKEHLVKKDIVALDMAISALSAEGEYIKKEELIEETEINIKNGWFKTPEDVLQSIKEEPTYSFPDREKGEWKKIWRDDCECSEYVCSKCDCGEDYVTDFCPNCGADMRGDKAND